MYVGCNWLLTLKLYLCSYIESLCEITIDTYVSVTLQLVIFVIYVGATYTWLCIDSGFAFDTLAV